MRGEAQERRKRVDFMSSVGYTWMSGVQRLIPKQLRLTGTVGVGVGPNDAKLAALSRVEPARGDVDVLRFHLQFPAAVRQRPRLGGVEQELPHTPSTVREHNPNVPQHGQIVSPFEHLESWGSSRHCGTTNTPPAVGRQEQRPS